MVPFEEEEERREKQRDIKEEVLVHYEQDITCLRIVLAVAGLDEVAKERPSYEDLGKFPDAEEKEDIESSEVSVGNELPPQLLRRKRGRKRGVNRRKR